MPDSDTALLFELVTTTISQLNELEQLVSNAEKLTGDLQKYNELAVDHWYRAKRIAYLVEDFQTLGDTKIKNLGELNQAVRELKYNIEELESMLLEYGLIKYQSNAIAKSAEKDDSQIKRDIEFANLQIERIHNVDTVGNAQKINAQINAYANRNLIDIKNKSNQSVKLMAEQNKILASKAEMDTKNEIEKKKYYNLSLENKKKNPQPK